MKVDWKLVAEIIRAAAWPSVAAYALFLLKRPLIDFVSQLASRAQKVSVFQVSVELATVPEVRPSWSVRTALGTVDVNRLTSSQVFDSGTLSLITMLLSAKNADCAVIDLGKGEEWLTSRLFIFSLILGEAVGTRALVFVESANGVRKRFLGVASPSEVRRCLRSQYPWFEEAYSRAMFASIGGDNKEDKAGSSKFSNVTSPLEASDPNRLNTLAKQFIEMVQRHTEPPSYEKGSYLEITGDLNQPDPTQKQWERAKWIDGKLLDDINLTLVEERCEESPDKSRIVLREEVARRKGAFVALVDTDRRFIGLVDRNAVLGELVNGREFAETASTNAAQLSR